MSYFFSVHLYKQQIKKLRLSCIMYSIWLLKMLLTIRCELKFQQHRFTMLFAYVCWNMVLGIIELLYNAGKDLRPQLAYSAFGKRTLEQYHFFVVCTATTPLYRYMHTESTALFVVIGGMAFCQVVSTKLLHFSLQQCNPILSHILIVTHYPSSANINADCHALR